MMVSSMYCLVLFLALSFGPSSTGKGASSFPDTFFVVYATGTLREGHPVTLSCHVEGPSAASFTRPSSYMWVKDGKVIPGQTGINYNVGPLTKQDEGDYQCGDPGLYLPRGKYQLNVFIPGKDMIPKPTVFQSGFPVADRPFFLDCVILENYAANANTKYTWYKDHTKVQGETSQLLRFLNLREADEGEYVCTAREGPVETTSPPSAEYYLKPLVALQVRIIANNSVVKGVLRENLTLTCEVTRAFPVVPMNGYSWSYLPSNQEQRRPLEEKSSTLRLSPLTRSHSGQYQCQARNDHDFPGMELTGRASVAVDVVYLENISMTHDLEVTDGEPLTLTCTVDSHPAARLTWTVNGKDLRHVTSNLDHYFIPSTSCSDSGNYTCRASNTYIPDQEKTAATHVQVNCIRDPRHQRPQNGVIYSKDSAPLDFFLPKQTVMAIVHPRGHDIITFFPNCSYVISEAFGSRCLHPYCDLEGRHVSFTLAQLTEKDEGNYICMEEGKELRTIPNCIRRLVVLGQSADGMPPETKAWVIAPVLIPVLLAVAVTTLIIMRRRRNANRFNPAISDPSEELHLLTGNTPIPSETLVTEESHSFETLYKEGTVYVVPKLAPPNQQALAVGKLQRSSSVQSHNSEHVMEQTELTVKNMFILTLQQSTGRGDPPSFLLHNIPLSWLANVILVLSSKLGVVLITVEPDEDTKNLHVHSLEKAGSQLLEAKSLVSKKLEGIVKSEAITAVLALPNLPDSDMTFLRQRIEVLRVHPELEVLMGQDGARFRQWPEHLSRTLSDARNFLSPGVDSPVTAFKMVASKFLTLAGYCGAEDSQETSTAARSWLLTPPQLEVRDSTAKLLHVWGSPGSGKTRLLIYKARRWLAEGKAVVLAVGREIYDVLLAHISEEVLKQQNDEARLRIRVCRIHTELALTLKELRGQYPNTEICLAIDTLRDPVLFRNMLVAVREGQVSAVWSVCTDSLQVISPTRTKEAQKLGWESIKLEESIRCTKDTIDLLNQLGKEYRHHYPIEALSIPCIRDVPKWKVVDHCLHPDYSTTILSCDCCKKELYSVRNIQDKKPSWKDWIALYTGNPNEHTDIQPVCTFLQNYGIPASLDSHYEIVASHGSHPDSSETGVAKWVERVVAGQDETGKPTVHLVRVKDFAGMEKGGVLLVHWDERDNDPECQSRVDRDARLKEHRYLWFLAVSRCKGQVILLLLTPSPVRRLLNLQEPSTPIA